MRRVKKGIYKHFKGGNYEVVDTAINSETLEEMVIYKHLDDEKDAEFIGRLWIRPVKMFLEKIEINNKKVNRFKLLKESP